jgi:outer membrane protein OmpA-like peptidoglycan-associated protein
MKDNAALKLEVGGHTDSDGDAAKNLALSQARADAVKKALVDQGVDAARLTTKGYGATKPIDLNTTPEGKANNRRVEFAKLGG